MNIPKFISIVIALFSIVLVSAEKPVFVMLDQPFGCDTLTVHFITNTPVTTAYNWNFGDGSPSKNTNNPTHKYDRPGKYIVSLKANNDSSEKKTILVGKTFRPNFRFVDTLSYGTFTYFFKGQFNDTSGLSRCRFKWTLSDGYIDTTRQFIHQFSKEGEYTVKYRISDVLGCADSSFRKVVVRDTFNIPNVFTPNNDNINDFFVIPSNGKTLISLKIFTRAGILVYEEKSKIMKWDGRAFSGEIVNPGMYYYIVETSEYPPFTKKSGFVYVFWK